MENLSIKNNEILTESQFNSLKNMLNSPDKENSILAFGIIERFDFNKNFIPLILLMTFTNSDLESWKDQCKDFYNFCKKKQLGKNSISYTRINKVYNEIDIKNREHEIILIKNFLQATIDFIDSFKFGELEHVSVKYRDQEDILINKLNG